MKAVGTRADDGFDSRLRWKVFRWKVFRWTVPGRR